MARLKEDGGAADGCKDTVSLHASSLKRQRSDSSFLQSKADSLFVEDSGPPPKRRKDDEKLRQPLMETNINGDTQCRKRSGSSSIEGLELELRGNWIPCALGEEEELEDPELKEIGSSFGQSCPVDFPDMVEPRNFEFRPIMETRVPSMTCGELCDESIMNSPATEFEHCRSVSGSSHSPLLAVDDDVSLGRDVTVCKDNNDKVLVKTVMRGYELVAKKKEVEYCPNPYFMETQAEIDASMRSVLIDWMMEVSHEYGLKRITLQRALNYTDRYLTLHVVPRRKLQLLGVTSLFIASKFDEIYPPSVRDFALTTDGACTDDSIKQFERLILEVLEWRLVPVTCHCWITFFVQRLAHIQLIYRSSQAALRGKEGEGEMDESIAIVKNQILDEDRVTPPPLEGEAPGCTPAVGVDKHATRRSVIDSKMKLKTNPPPSSVLVKRKEEGCEYEGECSDKENSRPSNKSRCRDSCSRNALQETAKNCFTSGDKVCSEEVSEGSACFPFDNIFPVALFQRATDLIDVCLLDISNLHHRRSHVAAAALLVAFKTAIYVGGGTKSKKLLEEAVALSLLEKERGWQKCFNYMLRLSFSFAERCQTPEAAVKRTPQPRVQREVEKSEWHFLQQYNPEALTVIKKSISLRNSLEKEASSVDSGKIKHSFQVGGAAANHIREEGPAQDTSIIIDKETLQAPMLVSSSSSPCEFSDEFSPEKTFVRSGAGCIVNAAAR
eukprot:g2625.t1